MTLPEQPAARHREIAAAFTRRVLGARSWDAPAPVAGWTAQDVFMHTWDLARATGQDDRLDQEFCARLLAGMEQMEAAIRASGQYGPAVAVPPDADAQTRLLGFIGRDPFWTPPR